MYAVGHLSIGYLLSKASGRFLNQQINLPLVFLLALLPDIDIIIPYITHRTVTHSVIVLTIVSVPFLLAYKTRALPYFVALIQHSLVGDFLTGGTYRNGTLLFWPMTSNPYGLPINVMSIANVAVEWGSFSVAMLVMLRSKDLKRLLRGKLSNLWLSIPTATVLFPTFTHFPIPIPRELLIPHFVYLALLLISIGKAVFSKTPVI